MSGNVVMLLAGTLLDTDLRLRGVDTSRRHSSSSLPFHLPRQQAGEVLRGLPIARWKEYRVLYRKANNVRVVVRRQNHLKAIAAGLGRQQTDQDAAKVLTDLSVSGSSQTGSDPSTPSRSHSDGGGTKACEIDQDE